MTDPTVEISAEATAGPASHRPRRRDIAWLVLPAASGIAVGLLWWLLAPGGGNLLSGNPALANPSVPASWLPRDLVLGGLALVAGVVTGFLLDGKLNTRGAGQRFAFALLGGAAGAVVSWLIGLLAAQLWGPAVDPALGSDYGFTLRSYSVLALWPGATAFVTFVLSLFGVLSGKPVK